MRKKFAHLHFVETLDQISSKPSISQQLSRKSFFLKKTPALLRDWYIDKFNPYLMESISILDAEGYTVHLPLRPADASQDPERARQLIRRTLQDLKEQDVDILLPPKDCPFDFPNDLLIADGKRLFPYFIMDAIEKVLKILGYSLKDAEIAIFADDPFLAQNLLYNIYPHVNFLSVIVDASDIEAYRRWADFIFSDTGLNLSVIEKNKNLIIGTLAEADIVISTSPTGAGFDYSYKRGAVYFDLGAGKNTLLGLAGIREDLLLIDGLKICFGDVHLLLPQLEAVFFVKSKTYRTLLRRGFNPDLAEAAAKDIKKYSPRLSHVCFREQALNNLHFAKLQASQER